MSLATEHGLAAMQRENQSQVTATIAESLSLDMSHIVTDLRSTFNTGKTKSLQWRKQQLNQLTKLIKENYDEIFEAVGKDHLNSSGFRGIVDIAPAMGAISQAISNLDEWAADVPCKAPMFGDAFIRSEPKGVMLIIAPWNYPLAMVLDPLIPAIAAGNCVVIKPSEVSNHSSDVLFSLLNKYMDRSCVRTVLGGVPETTALLEQKWDHIMYTGNGSVGRIVMTAAAKNLTPVTLELGGKSPTYVDKSANIEKAAQKLMFWKYGLNVGQTCIAPDYVLVHKDVEQEFDAACVETLNKYFGADLDQQRKKHVGYARVINERHTERIEKMIKSTNGNILIGGEVDATNCYIAPTIVKVPNTNEPLMRQEIFGPVLPVMVVNDVRDAVEKTNQICDHPLALYIFSEDEKVIDTYLGCTTSGGVSINTVMEHQQAKDMPFGGVGESGMGAYHGKYGFDEFSHQRSVFRRSTGRFGGSGMMGSPTSLSSEKFYNLALKLIVTGFLTDGQKTALKALGGGALALLGARYFRAKL